jgi:aspartyl-tRNA(Asn)/glutamyl-tRNA(Gln) amidotransferase subunit C
MHAHKMAFSADLHRVNSPFRPLARRQVLRCGCCAFDSRPTMSLTLPDIDRLAQLARLDLTASERDHMLTDLNAFFAVVEQMRAVNTDGVEPLSHPLSAVQDMPLRLRDDAVTEGNIRDAALRNAPDAQDGLFLVPRVVE